MTTGGIGQSGLPSKRGQRERGGGGGAQYAILPCEVFQLVVFYSI